MESSNGLTTETRVLLEEIKAIPHESIEHFILQCINSLQHQALEMAVNDQLSGMDDLACIELHNLLEKCKLNSFKALSILNSICPSMSNGEKVEALSELLRELFPFNIRKALRHLESAAAATKQVEHNKLVLLLGNSHVSNVEMMQFLSGSGQHASPTGSAVCNPVLVSLSDDTRSVALFDLCSSDGTAGPEAAFVNSLIVTEAVKRCCGVNLVVVHRYDELGDHVGSMMSLINSVLDMVSGITKHDKTRLQSVQYLYLGYHSDEEIIRALANLRTWLHDEVAGNAPALWVLDDMVKKRKSVSTVNQLTDDAGLLLSQLADFGGDGLPGDAVDFNRLLGPSRAALEQQAMVDLKQLQIALDIKALNVAAYHLSNLQELKHIGDLLCSNRHADRLSEADQIINDRFSALSSAFQNNFIGLLTRCEQVGEAEEDSLMEDLLFLIDFGEKLHVSVQFDSLPSELDAVVADLSELELNDPRVCWYLANCQDMQRDFNALLLQDRFQADYQLLVTNGFAKLLEIVRVASADVDCVNAAIASQIIFEVTPVFAEIIAEEGKPDPRIQCMETIIAGAEQYVLQIQAQHMRPLQVDGVAHVHIALTRLEVLANYPELVCCAAICSGLMECGLLVSQRKQRVAEFDCHKPCKSLVGVVSSYFKERLSYFIRRLQHRLNGDSLEQYFVHMEMLEDLHSAHDAVSLPKQCSIEALVFDQVMRLVHDVFLNPSNCSRLINVLAHVIHHRERLDLRCNDVVQRIAMEVEKRIEQHIAASVRSARDCGLDIAHSDQISVIMAQLDAVETWRTCFAILLPCTVVWFEQAHSQLMDLLHQPLSDIAMSIEFGNGCQQQASQAEFVDESVEEMDSLCFSPLAFSKDIPAWNLSMVFLLASSEYNADGTSEWHASCDALLLRLQAHISSFGEFLASEVASLWSVLQASFPISSDGIFLQIESTVGASGDCYSAVNALDAAQQLEVYLQQFQQARAYPLLWKAIDGNTKHQRFHELYNASVAHFRMCYQSATMGCNATGLEAFWRTLQRLTFADQMFSEPSDSFGAIYADYQAEQLRALLSLTALVQEHKFAKAVQHIRSGVPLQASSSLILLKCLWMEEATVLLGDIRQQVFMNRPTRCLWSPSGYVQIRELLSEARAAVHPILAELFSALSCEEMQPLLVELRAVEEFIGREVIDALLSHTLLLIKALEFVQAEEQLQSLTFLIEAFPECSSLPSSAVTDLGDDLIATIRSQAEICVDTIVDVRQGKVLWSLQKLEAAVLHGSGGKYTMHCRQALSVLLTSVGQVVRQTISELRGISRERDGDDVVSGNLLAALRFIISSSSELRRLYGEDVDDLYIRFLRPCV